MSQRFSVLYQITRKKRALEHEWKEIRCHRQEERSEERDYKDYKQSTTAEAVAVREKERKKTDRKVHESKKA
jgi:hypothetical protein